MNINITELNRGDFVPSSLVAEFLAEASTDLELPLVSVFFDYVRTEQQRPQRQQRMSEEDGGGLKKKKQKRYSGGEMSQTERVLADYIKIWC
jgi:hypothetical protein